MKKYILIFGIFIVLMMAIYLFMGVIKCDIKYNDDEFITSDYKAGNYHIYYMGIDKFNIRYLGKYKSVKYLIKNNKISVDKLINRIDKNNLSVITCNGNVIFSKEFDPDRYCYGINVLTTKIEIIDGIKSVKIEDKYKKVFNTTAQENDLVKVYYSDKGQIISVAKVNTCYSDHKGC